MSPFQMCEAAGVFGGSFLSTVHGSSITSSLVRETTEHELANYGQKFGQKNKTDNIVAANGTPHLLVRFD